MEPSILDPLNERQREAVTYGEGPLLIVAGVGTGKTMAITRRIAWLIAEKRAKPSEILALTFTEKAAREMEERVDVLVPYGYIEATIGTFHGFCDRVLRENAVLLGLDPAFRVLAEPEQIMFLRAHLFDLPLDRFRPLGNPIRHLHALVGLFSRAKDEDVTPDDYRAFVDGSQRGGGDAEDALDHAELAAVYAAYQALLAENGCVDFGDLIAHCLRLFRDHTAVLKRYQERYRYILVDEFQDTNHAQFELLRLLAGAQNLTVCGDDDQSIYRFRGAAIDNILGFVESFPDARQVVLDRNYRSTQPILDAAYRLIQFNNPERLEVRTGVAKRLRAVTDEDRPVEQRHFDSLDEESDFVARSIREDAGRGVAFAETAILVRANSHAEPFLRALNLQRVPWRFSGSRGLYDQDEIQSITSLLRVLADPADSQSLHFLAAGDPYRVDGETLAELTGRARRRRSSLLATMRRALREEEGEDDSTSGEARDALTRLDGDLSAMLDLSSRLRTGEIIYHYLTTQTGLLEAWSNSHDPIDAVRVQNVAKLFTIVQRFSRIAAYDRVPWFVDYLDALVVAGDNPPTGEADPDADAVHVLTIHQAKGLEFDSVYMVGLVDGRFPSVHRRDPLTLPEALLSDRGSAADAHRREERRLFYVGMTRARRRLVLTSARDCGGKRARKPSQFISEALNLPATHITPEKGSPLVTIGRHATSDAVAALRRRSEGDPRSPITLSHDRIRQYRYCPRSYRYRHVLDVPARPHHGMVFGSAVHRAIARLNQARLEGTPLTLPSLEEHYRAFWRSEGFLSPEHEQLRFNEGLEALADLHRHVAEEDSTPTLVEHRFTFSMEGVKVVGVFDRVDQHEDGGVIIDYKTSGPRTAEEAEGAAKKDLQLAIYALAYRDRFGELPRRLELHFLTPRVVIGRAPPLDASLTAARKAVTTVADGVRAGRFPPTPSPPVCRACAYSGICPERRLG
ncbi:MAG: ATP-dependent helicase [Candidatus Bipolaricaulota bacterium]|nr:MAG: ATP-dependent helicase [Candidatus Bipolaricaulota bacterium]